MKILLELADNMSKRALGLMHRKTLEANDGMIFIFPRKEHQGFWMQNTYIPLDIAFLDDSGKIFQIEEMKPLSTRMTRSCQPCKYAIEMNQGWFKENNINVGHQVFKNDDWLTSLRKSATFESYFNRFAQVEIEDDIEPNNLEGEVPQEFQEELTEPPPDVPEMNPEMQPEMQPQMEQPQQINPDIELNMNQEQKIKMAEQNNSDMEIVYWTLSGKVLPPRKLTPVPNEGYPIKSGPNGNYFTAYDASPTINGGTWAIEGGKPKNFLIDNIISLDIESKGETPPQVEQNISQPQNFWDRLKNMVR